MDPMARFDALNTPDVTSGSPAGVPSGTPVPAHRHRVVVNSPVVLGFVALCVIATVAGYLTNDVTTKLFFSSYRSSPFDLLGYVRLVGHVFGHAGSEHLVSNMIYILLLGPLLEEKYGSRTLLGVMLVAAVATGLVNAILFGNRAILGASGIVFAFILLSSATSFREGEIPLTFILVAVFFLGQQVYQGVFVADNVSNLSHIVGGLVGAADGFALVGRRKPA